MRFFIRGSKFSAVERAARDEGGLNAEMACVCVCERTYNTTVVLFVLFGAFGTRGACGRCRTSCADVVGRDDTTTASSGWLDRQVPMSNSLSMRCGKILQVEVGKLL